MNHSGSELKKQGYNWQSFYFAYRGLIIAFKDQYHMRVHGIITLIVVVTGILIGLSPLEWIAVLLCTGMVFAAEIINSAMEELVNLVSPEFNRSAGRIKDMAAGAVLFASIMAAVAGLIIFIPKILKLI